MNILASLAAKVGFHLRQFAYQYLPSFLNENLSNELDISFNFMASCFRGLGNVFMFISEVTGLIHIDFEITGILRFWISTSQWSMPQQEWEKRFKILFTGWR